MKFDLGCDCSETGAADRVETKKRKRPILYDVIDIDIDDDDHDNSHDSVITAEIVSSQTNKAIKIKELVDGDEEDLLIIGENVKDGITSNFKCLKKINPRDCRHRINKPIPFEYSQNWTKRIQKEWKILEKNLPDSIHVRVYESNMDVMRAVIIGAEGTPYHDGLFFFDLFFTGFFPNSPPNVNFHNLIGSSKLNPNVNEYGHVCLSLLNSWSGNKNELWRPDFSTILQILVSLQGLVLTEMPVLNAPQTNNSPKKLDIPQCLYYNQEVFIDSLWLMIHIIRRPPKSFEDFVVEHFRNRAHDIMRACKAYMEGAEVGFLVKTEGAHLGSLVRKEGAQLSSLCKKVFKNSLRKPMEELVKEFDRIGAKY